MKFITLVVLQFLLLIMLFSGCTRKEAEVVVCGTLHGFHKVNPNYTYDTLFRFIDEYYPDIIGVEVRPEDLHHKKLTEYYPYEMTEVIARYKDTEAYGIDWWNAQIAGMLMSDSIIAHLPNIVREQQYLSDTAFLKTKPAILKDLFDQKRSIAKTASIKEMICGNYDSLNLRYYDKLGQFLAGSVHEKLFASYMQRHEKIANNIAAIVKANPGKKMLFLVGADHQLYARLKLEEVFQGRVQLNNCFRPGSENTP